jgi:hypothetical protein
MTVMACSWVMVDERGSLRRDGFGDERDEGEFHGEASWLRMNEY